MHLLAVRCSPTDAELVADRCWQAGAAGLWEVEEVAGEEVVLRVGVPEASLGAFREALADLAPVDVTDEDRVELATREVVVAGPGGGEVTLAVPPTVFGDGAHPTTAACLEAVRELARAGGTVLDVGCGSGALSVVAARAGARVVAVDVDPAAVEATTSNATANGVVVDASTTPLAEVQGRFDLVVANISAGTVLGLLPDLGERVAADGHLVLSGILADRWPEVREAATASGGGRVVSREVEVGGWVTAVLARG